MVRHLLPCTAVSCVLFLVCCVLCFLFYGVCSVCFVICVVFRILCCVSVTLPCELCASDSLCVAIPLQDRLPAPTIVPPAFQDSSASIISPAALPFHNMCSEKIYWNWAFPDTEDNFNKLVRCGSRLLPIKLWTEQVWAQKTPLEKYTLEEYTLKIEVGKLLWS